MTNDPILVTGMPRSGTSLVTGILSVCGAWVGTTYPPDEYNRKGNQENCAIREGLVKPYLTLQGLDSLGLTHLGQPGSRALFPGGWWRKRVMATVEKQGCSGVWAYKDAKLCLMWRQWTEAFPRAKWIVVRRDADAVIASCIRAEPMVRRMGVNYAAWMKWAESYLEHIESMPAHLEIWPDRDVFTGGKMQDVVERMGLEWRESAVSAFIDRELWHGVG